MRITTISPGIFQRNTAIATTSARETQPNNYNKHYDRLITEYYNSLLRGDDKFVPDKFYPKINKNKPEFQKQLKRDDAIENVVINANGSSLSYTQHITRCRNLKEPLFKVYSFYFKRDLMFQKFKECRFIKQFRQTLNGNNIRNCLC